MVKVCVVPSCLNRWKNKEHIKRHRISFFQPTTTIRLQRWSKALGIVLKSTDKVCQFHFKEQDVKFYDKIVIGNTVHLQYLHRKILKDKALPTKEYQFNLNSELQQQQQARQEPINEYYTQQQQHQLTEIIDPIAQIKDKISALPPYWFYINKPKEIEFMRLDPTSKQIVNHIILNENLSIIVVYSNNEKKALDEKIVSSDEVYEYLKSVEKWPLCVGTQFDKKRYSQECKGVVIGDDAYQRHQMNPRCMSCAVLRLRFQKHRRLQSHLNSNQHLQTV
ncbi:uncharacterized protein LOC115890545 isoform X2 [Sitophilus oryzae]|uniref:Uncharacterized protein LOC115890545 isoform X2 n=1 Tax=Sitophilus oryzae TaxID=7048 RepID=A0A6J2YTP0_SITOR|nr:uncharacterized protein LOC115890545 isoform X2 [Sitophilus oryzae]